MSVKNFQIKISDITVDVIKKDVKNLNLRVYPPAGDVRLSIPKSVSEKAVRQFLFSKLDWMEKKIKKVQSRPQLPELKYVQGETHYVHGNKYRLNIIEKDKAPKVNIREEQFIDLYVRPGSSQGKREKVMREWYRSLLKEEIPILIKKWEPRLDVTVNEWGVKKMKTRWGTCNTKARRIWLNLELAKRPQKLLDYVVLHEIVHLKERLHNARFKSFLSRYMPDWRERENELDGKLC